MPHNRRRAISGQEDGPGVAQLDDVAPVETVDAAEAEFMQPVLQPLDGYESLGTEGRGAFDQVAPFPHVQSQEQHLKVGRELVLAPLTGYLHGERQPHSSPHGVHGSAGDVKLIGS